MRRLLPVALALVIAIVAAMMVGTSDQRRDGPTGDPRATTDAGTRAAVLLIESEGRSVSTGGVDRRADVVVLFHSRGGEWESSDYQEWVEVGGQLIVFGGSADVGAPTGPISSIDAASRCDRAEYVNLAAPAVGVGPSVSGDAATSCFGVGGGWFFTVSELGEGVVVSVATSRPFLNGSLAEGDHAGLLLALLGETSGSVRFVDVGAGVGGGDQTLADLVIDPVWAFLFMLGLAWVVFMMQRGRRLGRPIGESNLVQIDGFEMVRATARLYDKSDARRLGVDRMRAELLEQLTNRWAGQASSSMNAEVSVDEARRFATLLRLDEQASLTLEIALTGSVNDDVEFVSVAAALVNARGLGSGRTNSIRVKTENR